eukprot:scaffold9108_cov152-Isochrysis_galbana.AAC.1
MDDTHVLRIPAPVRSYQEQVLAPTICFCICGLPVAVFCFLAGTYLTSSFGYSYFSTGSGIFAISFHINGACILFVIVGSFMLYYRWENDGLAKLALCIAIVLNAAMVICCGFIISILTGENYEWAETYRLKYPLIIGVSIFDGLLLPLAIKKVLWNRVYPTLSSEPLPAASSTSNTQAV